jgi:hypothetical protein
MAEETKRISDSPPTNGGGHNYSDKAKDALRWLKTKGSDALQSAESAFNTVTGKEALEKVASYIQESEAVNAAMATRIYNLLDREALLQERVAATEKTSKRHTTWLIATSVVYGASIIGFILYLVLRRS